MPHRIEWSLRRRRRHLGLRRQAERDAAFPQHRRCWHICRIVRLQNYKLRRSDIFLPMPLLRSWIPFRIRELQRFRADGAETLSCASCISWFKTPSPRCRGGNVRLQTGCTLRRRRRRLGRRANLCPARSRRGRARHSSRFARL